MSWCFLKRRRRHHPSDFDQWLQEAAKFMAKLTDVQDALTGLKTDFDTLVVAAKAAYDAKPAGAATEADLDGIVQTITDDRAVVKNAITVITGVTS